MIRKSVRQTFQTIAKSMLIQKTQQPQPAQDQQKIRPKDYRMLIMKHNFMMFMAP